MMVAETSKTSINDCRFVRYTETSMKERQKMVMTKRRVKAMNSHDTIFHAAAASDTPASLYIRRIRAGRTRFNLEKSPTSVPLRTTGCAFIPIVAVSKSRRGRRHSLAEAKWV